MLIVFVATQEGAPDLRNLNVEDFTTGLAVPVGGLDGWDDDFLQVQLMSFAPCTYSDEVSNTVAFDTDTFWCRRLSKGLAALTFSTALATCVVTPLYYDRNNVLTIGSPVTVTATSRTDVSGNYIAEVVEFSLNGANQCALHLAAPSSGTVFVRQAGV